MKVITEKGLEAIREFHGRDQLTDEQKELLERLEKVIDEIDPPEVEEPEDPPEIEEPSKYDREPVYVASTIRTNVGTAKYLYFTDIEAPVGTATTDLSVNRDKSVLGWKVGDAYYISSLSEDKKIVAPEDCTSFLSSRTGLIEVDFKNLDTSQTTTFSYFFSGCTLLERANLNEIDVSNATSLANFFESCSELEEIDIDSWEAGKCNFIYNFANGASKLKRVKARNLLKKPVEGTISIYNSFRDCSSLEEIDLSNWNFKDRDVDLANLFTGCGQLKLIYAQSWTKDWAVTSTKTTVFSKCTSLPGFSTSKINNTYCKNISEGGYFSDPIPDGPEEILPKDERSPLYIQELLGVFIDPTATKLVFTDVKPPGGASTVDHSWGQDGSVKGWLEGDTYYISSLSPAKVLSVPENGEGLFEGMEALKEIDFSNLDTSETKYFDRFLSATPSLEKVNFDELDLRQAESLSEFLSYSGIKRVSGDNLTAPNCTDFNSFFNGCESLEKVSLRNLIKDVEGSINLTSFFEGCSGLREADLSNWDFSGKSVNTSKTFKGCPVLRVIYGGDWTASGVLSGSGTFDGSASLPGYTDGANTHCKSGVGGYFTAPLPDSDFEPFPCGLSPIVIRKLIRIADHVDEIDPV